MMVMDNRDADLKHVRIIQQWQEHQRGCAGSDASGGPSENDREGRQAGSPPSEIEMKESARILCERYFDGVSRMFSRPGISRREREDLVQETLLRALRGLDSFRNDSPFKYWLFTIARNLRINAGQQRSRYERSTSSIEETAVRNVAAPADHPLRRALLEEALASLPPQQGRCMRLRLEGYSGREIATLMRISEGAVKAHLFHARRHLEAFRADLEPLRYNERSTAKP